ncbi:MAG: hypothetical protein AB1Z19_00450, partial [Eubacteriales bacterium]
MMKRRFGFFVVAMILVVILTAGVTVSAAGGPSEAEAEPVSPNEFFSSTISGIGTTHYYAFTAESDVPAVFTLVVPNGAGVCKVSIYDGASPAPPILSEDQTGDISVDITPSVGVTYFIKVEALLQDEIFYHGLIYQDNVGDDGASAVEIRNGDAFYTYLDDMGSSGDVDVFKYTVEAEADLPFYFKTHIYNEYQGEDPETLWTAEVEVYDNEGLTGTPIYSTGGPVS